MFFGTDFDAICAILKVTVGFPTFLFLGKKRFLGAFWLLLGCSGRALGRSWLSLGDLLGPSGCSWGALGELLEALGGLLGASWGQFLVSHVSLFQRGPKLLIPVGRFWLQKGSDFETTLKKRNVGNQKLAPRGP